MNMFDTEIVTTVKTVNGKRYISDEESLSEMDMADAQAEFLTAEKCFRVINADPDVVTDMLLNVRWWNALERLYQAERELERLFLGSDRSRTSAALYNQYRDRLVKGKRLEPSA